MKSKKGLIFSWIGKIIIILIIFVILLSIFGSLFGGVKKSILLLTDKKINEFQYLGGSYVHPDLMGTGLDDFWFKGFQNFIKEAITTENQCLGSFYIDDRIDMMGTHISFVNESTGITMFLRDSKGVVAVLNDEIFKNTEDYEWKLCVIDPQKASSFTDVFLSSYRSNNLPFLENEKIKNLRKEVHSLTIDFYGKTKGKEIQGSYFTSKKLKEKDAQKEFFHYHSYIVGRTRDLINTLNIFYEEEVERYLFFYVISEDKEKGERYFCLLPTTRDKGNSEAYYLDDFQDSIRSQAKYNPERINNVNTFCKLPGREESEESSIFKGFNSCYYYSCQDAEVNSCKDIFVECKGLCSPVNEGVFLENKCKSCQDITKCKDYKDVGGGLGSCGDDLCSLGCWYPDDKCVEK